MLMAERGGGPRQATLGRRGVALMVHDVLRTSHLPCPASLELLRSLSLPAFPPPSLPWVFHKVTPARWSPDSPNLPYFPAHLAPAPASQRTGMNTSVSTIQSRILGPAASASPSSILGIWNVKSPLNPTESGSSF